MKSEKVENAGSFDVIGLIGQGRNPRTSEKTKVERIHAKGIKQIQNLERLQQQWLWENTFYRI
jgi:hypothetical protein